jgi:anthranilate phosphoribosyltransferase
MNIQQAIGRMVESADLNSEEMRAVMHQVMGGEATPAQIGAFLVALRIKGETIDEIAAATEVMRELATRVEIDADYLVDIVGTGGDGANLFNVSTAACFVVAAAGGHVAKHGNRSVSSTSGSSDVLQALGVQLELSPEQVARCVREVGMGFMFAPLHHSAMKHAAGPRKDLGLRTIFNMLGPMTNPAGVKRQLIGVFDPGLCRPMAEVLKRLGSEQVMVVHAHDGLDEISIAAPTHVVELRDGTIGEFDISPADFGRSPGKLEGLVVSSSEESVQLIRGALTGKNEDAANMVIMNAGAAIYVSGLAATMADGVQMAEDAIDSGAAMQKITDLVQFTELAVASQ